MQVLISKEVEYAEKDGVSYEIQWTIPNWRQVRQDVNLVRNQKAVFKTVPNPTQMIQTKWLIGLMYDCHGGGSRVGVFWQLLGIKGSGSQLTLDAQMKTVLCSADKWGSDKIVQLSRQVNLGEIIEPEVVFLDIKKDLWNVNVDFDHPFITSNGAIQFKLFLTLKIPEDDFSASDTKKLKLEQFSKRSHAQLRENLGRLLNEDSNGDLKIVTSDGVKLRAYQSILKAQCPVFAGMLNSGLSESKTGIVKVEDISGKTMKILLHYFYTGDLLNGWNDADTIVEFTYAAGKYQITQVLELLDDMVGRSILTEVSNLGLELLSLSGKLSLKNAEQRLLQQIVGIVAAAKSSADLFKLLGVNSEGISRSAEEMGREPLEESKLLEIWDYAVGNTEQQVDFSGQVFRLLALVQRKGSLKGLEQVLLKQVAEITSKFTSAEELVEFLGLMGTTSRVDNVLKY